MIFWHSETIYVNDVNNSLIIQKTDDNFQSIFQSDMTETKIKNIKKNKKSRSRIHSKYCTKFEMDGAEEEKSEREEQKIG